MKHTDEQHPLTISEVIDKLNLYGIEAERKSVSRDLQVLNDSGYTILSAGKYDGYYMADREFEDYELMVIQSAISSAKFITKKDSANIIKKIKRIATPSLEKILNDMLYIDGTVKTDNLAAKYAIDKVIEAIKGNRKLNFKYFEYDFNGNKQLRRGGHIYTVSPFYLVWSNEEYYLLANPDSHNNITHFKIAMMTEVSISDNARKKRTEVTELQGNFDLCKYIRSNIHMYTGKVEDITALCHNSLRTEVLSRFGRESRLRKVENNCFEAHLRVANNDGLYQWLMQFGEKIKVVSPEHIRDKVKNLLCDALRQYENEITIN